MATTKLLPLAVVEWILLDVMQSAVPGPGAVCVAGVLHVGEVERGERGREAGRDGERVKTRCEMKTERGKGHEWRVK